MIFNMQSIISLYRLVCYLHISLDINPTAMSFWDTSENIMGMLAKWKTDFLFLLFC